MTYRLPPSAAESEQCVIGCCLIEPVKCIPDAQMVFKTSNYFYDLRCRTVWDLICGMRPDSVNLISVRQVLKDANMLSQIGDIQFLSDCESMVTSTANLSEWIKTVQEKKILRDIIATCTDAVASAYENTSATKVLDLVESNILKIRPQENNSKDIRALMQEAISIIEWKSQNWESITGISTGLSDLDKKNDGMHPGEFIVIGAPTSCGKTALALNIIVHNSLNGTSCAFLSAEMLPARLVVRSICAEARVNLKKITEDDLPKMTVVTGKISNSPIHIDNVNGFTIGQVRAYARRLKQQHGIKILAVENIQLITGSGDNREQEIASVSRGLKAIAMELNITVLGLSQLNDDGRLRESRAIGHDADTVWILANDGAWQPLVQPVDLKIEKSRDGETGVVKLIFRKEFTRFEQSEKVSSEDVPKHKPYKDE
jgi:replicative DNA helicase